AGVLVRRFQPMPIATLPFSSLLRTRRSSLRSEGGVRRSVHSPDSRITSPRFRPTASEVRYSAISSGDAIRANSKLSLPMGQSPSTLFVVLVGHGMLPRDGDLDLRLALLLARLDLEREVAIREHGDLVVAHGEGQRARPDAVGDAAQRIRRLGRRRGALELELLLVTHDVLPLWRL